MPLVFIADDDLMLHNVYSRLLQRLGYDCRLFENGREILDNIKPTPPDIIILDVEMPVMDGLTTCRELRKDVSSVNIPIIMISAHESEDDILSGLNAGANDYLIKPINEAALSAKLKAIVGVSNMDKNDIDFVKNRTIFAGRYQVEKLVGYGTHAVVYSAMDLESERVVALKLMKEDGNVDDLARTFMNTAEVLMELDSPCLLKIIDYGKLERRFFFILEYADGGDLSSILVKGKISEPQALKVTSHIASALKDMEKAEIIDLDIKPENIMLCGDTFKLGDFGIVTPQKGKTIPLNADTWTTAAYISPEYLNEEHPISVRSDVYSLGVTIYQAVTGDNPFQSTKPAVTMYRQLNFNPAPATERGACISKEFSDLIAKMMNKNPDQRPNPIELLEGLTGLMQNPENEV